MRFAKWLTERTEKVIAVVSHCDFLHAFFMNFGQHLEPSVCFLVTYFLLCKGKKPALKSAPYSGVCTVCGMVSDIWLVVCKRAYLYTLQQSTAIWSSIATRSARGKQVCAHAGNYEDAAPI